MYSSAPHTYTARPISTPTRYENSSTRMLAKIASTA